MQIVGAAFLGAVLGYLTHYLVRRDPDPGIADLAGIVASLLGGVVMGALGRPGQADGYFVGLGIGFFLFWLALAAGRESSPVRAEDQAEAGAGSDAVAGIPGRDVRLFPFLRRS